MFARARVERRCPRGMSGRPLGPPGPLAPPCAPTMENQSGSLDTIRQLLGSTTTIELQRVHDWMAEDDEEVLGALYVLVDDHRDRIAPPLPPIAAVDLLLRIMRVSSVRPGPREFSISPYDAAHRLLTIATACVSSAKRSNSSADLLDSLRDRLAVAYRSADDRLRRRIVDGFLEHAFETPSLRAIFESWRTAPALSQAYAEAAQWADSRNT